MTENTPNTSYNPCVTAVKMWPSLQLTRAKWFPVTPYLYLTLWKVSKWHIFNF